MKIKNPNTGEIIEVPKGMEDAVREAIESGSNPLDVMKYGGIHIKESKKGTFTAAATKHGMGVQEFAKKVLANKDEYSPAMVKKANFARNATKFKHEYGGYMEHGGGIDNPGFRALPDYVQEKIKENMAYGGCMECGGMMESGGKIPTDILRSRLESHMSPNEVQDYLDSYAMGGMLPEAKSGKWIQKAVKHPGRCTPGSPNYDCPKGSPQWRLAQTFKKHHGFHKEYGGYTDKLPEAQFGGGAGGGGFNWQGMLGNLMGGSGGSGGFGSLMGGSGNQGWQGMLGSFMQGNQGGNMVQPSQQLSTSYMPNSSMSSPIFQGGNKYMQDFAQQQGVANERTIKAAQNPTDAAGWISAGASQMSAGLDFTKGMIDKLNTQRRNARTARQNAELQRLSKQSLYEDTLPANERFNQYGALSMAYGGKINDYKDNFNPNVEAEGGEVAQLPNGLSGYISGNSHANGGETMNLPENSRIFSLKLKDPETKKSYSSLANRFKTEKDYDNLNSLRYNDNINNETAQLNIRLKNQELDKIFNQQERNKATGLHGYKVQMEALDDYLPMAQDGALMGYNPEQEIINANKMGVNLNNQFNPLKQENISSLNYSPSISTNPIITEQISNDLRNIYSHKSKPQSFIDYNPIGSAGYEQYWGSKENYEKNWIPKVKEAFSDPDRAKMLINRLENYVGQNEEETKDVRSKLQGKTYEEKIKEAQRLATDYKPGPYHAVLNQIIDYKEPKTETVTVPKKPEEKVADTKLPTEGFNYRRKEGFNFPRIDMPGFIMPSNYALEPVPLDVMRPQYIDPRYLDIQPQLNEITRGTRALMRGMPSDESVNIARAFQAQSNAYNAMQPVFGQKYNYDQQQDLAAQQANARAKMESDLRNIAYRQAFNEAIARGKGLRDTQIRTDREAALENMMKQRSYDLTRDYINRTFLPSDTANPVINPETNAYNQDYIDFLNSPEFKEAYNKRNKKKYGGLIKKIKPKIKK